MLVRYNTVGVATTPPSLVRATEVCRSLVERGDCRSQRLSLDLVSQWTSDKSPSRQ